MRPIDIILLLLAFGMAFMLWRIIAGKKRALLEARIARFQKNRPEKAKEESLRRKSTDITEGLLYRLVKPLPEFKNLGNQLERVGNPMSAKQYVLRRILSFLVIVFALCSLLNKPLLLGIPAAFLLGVWAPLFVLKRKINKQNREFLALFPDAIDLIVRGLRSIVNFWRCFRMLLISLYVGSGPDFRCRSRLILCRRKCRHPSVRRLPE